MKNIFKYTLLSLFVMTTLWALSSVKASEMVIQDVCAGDLGNPPQDKENAEKVCENICKRPPLKWMAPAYWKPLGKPGIFKSGDEAVKICQEQGLTGRSVCRCTFHNVSENQNICAGLLKNNDVAQQECPKICESAPRFQDFGGRWFGVWRSDKANFGEHSANDICKDPTKTKPPQPFSRSVCNCTFGFKP